MSESIDYLHPMILSVGLAVHNADWNWKNVNSPFKRIYYVTEGVAQLVMPTGVYDLRPGYLYYIPEYTTHSYICQSHFVHYYVHVYEDSLSNMDVAADVILPVEVKGGRFDLELIKRLCEMNPNFRLPQSNPQSYDNESTLVSNLIKNKQRTFSQRVESRGILYILLSRFYNDLTRKTNAMDSRIQHALSYIRKNIYEAVTIDSLADVCCLSKDHFIRLFKKETKTTPLKFINQEKMRRAQLLLVTDTMSIKNIAFQLNYDDCSYFNRLFKKTVGVTPQQYRQANKIDVS